MPLFSAKYLFFQLPAAQVPPFGYFGGGAQDYSHTVYANTDRISFPNSTTAANASSNLSAARYNPSGLSDKTTFGYFLGGTTTGAAGLNTADRITFSSGVTAANTISNTTIARHNSGSLSGPSFGYVAGGVSSASNATTAEIDQLTFSTGAMAANTAGSLSLARNCPSGTSDGTTYGYMIGGCSNSFQNGGTNYATADRITFSNSTVAANTVSQFSQIKYSNQFSLNDGGTYGYYGGGCTGACVVWGATDRITFSSGVTAANSVSNLSAARSAPAGLSDGATYGYFGGGCTTNGANAGGVATTDRITFSSGNTAALSAANLSTARMGAAGVSSVAV